MLKRAAVACLVEELLFSNIHLNAMLLAPFNYVWSVCKPGLENILPSSIMHVAHAFHTFL